MKQPVALSARERILEVAADRFYHDGIRAIGVDTIVKDAGITKMTLYRYFTSKNELVLAYLQERSDHFWEWFEEVLGQHPDQPRQQLEDYVEALGRRLEAPDYRGCAFLNVKVEFPDPEHPIRQHVSRQKERTRRRLAELATAAGAMDGLKVTDELLLLVNGAYASVQVYADYSLASSLKSAAQSILNAHLK